jgi:protein TonB
MKNSGLIILGTVLLLCQQCVLAQSDSKPEATVQSEETIGAQPELQDQQKSKTPPMEHGKFDTEPQLVKHIQPDYPDEAMKQSLEGLVWLQMLVGEDGKVVETKVQKSEAEVFNKAAIKAGSQWVFKPATLNGKPVASWITVPFRFTLVGSKKDGEGPKAKERLQPADEVSVEKGPEPIKNVQPTYPDAAKKSKTEGMVWVKVWVDEKGNVAEATVEKSDAKVLDSAAVAAVKQWKFKPAISKGKPVSLWVTIPFKFKLH